MSGFQKLKITPLCLASMNGHLNIVKYLTLDKHCDPAVRDDENVAPLHVAALNGHYDVVRYFMMLLKKVILILLNT